MYDLLVDTRRQRIKDDNKSVFKSNVFTLNLKQIEFWTYSTSDCSVSIVNIEQVNAGWIAMKNIECWSLVISANKSVSPGKIILSNQGFLQVEFVKKYQINFENVLRALGVNLDLLSLICSGSYHILFEL